MVNLACPESVETIKNFTILSTLQERLKDTNVISEIFHGKIHGWSKAIFVRIGSEKPLRRVLYLVENVNAQMTKLEQEKEMKVVRTGEETTVFGFTDKTNERYGGDEFLITFKGISHEVLRTRLEQMRAKAEKIKLQDYIF